MLHDAIVTKLVSLQSTMDTYKLPQNLQITLLKEVFDKSSKPYDFSSDFQGIPLGKLLTLAGPEWYFKCNEFQLPTTWNFFYDTYKKLGMASPQRWRLCTRRANEVHNPYIMRPSAQDVCIGKGRVVCQCDGKKILQRD